MTKKQREQVVEMLRCAADGETPLRTIEVDLDVPRELTMIALRVWDKAYRLLKPHEYRRSCLLAAQRVEEESWP
jgi:hypothetical protein